MITDTDIQQINAIISPLVGKESWGVKLGWGSFITFEFGNALPPSERGRVGGEWHLWVQHVGWRIENDEEVIAACEDDREELKTKVAVLDQVRLISFQIEKPSLETVISFSNSARLKLFPIYSSVKLDYDNWILFTPGDKVLVLGPGTTWSYK